MACAILCLFLGAVLTGAGILALEFLLTPFSLYYWFYCRRREPKPNKTCDPYGEPSLPFACNKEGTVWVLEQAKVPQICTKESVAKGTEKKEITKVHPIEKHAKIKDCALILSDADGSEVSIKLLDCIVTAVSASNKSSQKWAKRYPIKLESKSSFIYNGSKICYVYLSTSRDKESWCKALRLASCPDEERINSYARLSDDFQYYLAFIPFPKPFTMSGEAIERANRHHRHKRIHHLLKKFVKMTSVSSSSAHEKRKASDKLLDSKDTSLLINGVVKASSSEKSSSGSLQDQVQPFTPAQNSGGKILLPDISNSACNEKFVADEATLCWNLLFSRLFFDIKKNAGVNSFIKSQIQSALSDMRTPSYIGRMKCTTLDLGNRPPYIHQIRVISMDVGAIWAVEVDIEYSGGMMFDIETKYEVQGPTLQDTKDMILHPSSGREMITYVSEDGLPQLKRIGWASTCMSKWKAIKHSIADNVSHVPLSFTMRIASIRGTLQLHIKPPPSDQLWFGFTSMPEIDWNLEPPNGDQKISTEEIFLLLNDCFKDAIREFLVVPNFECICIPWMFDEKHDWVPLMVAPFEWVDGEVGTDTGDLDASNSQSEEIVNKQVDTDGSRANSSADHLSPSQEFLRDFEASETSPRAIVSPDQLSHTSMLDEEISPESRETQESSYRVASPMISSSEAGSQEGRKSVHFEVDLKPRKVSRKLWKDMGKIVGDKIEEQRRHIGEKGRHLVGKMRETTRT